MKKCNKKYYRMLYKKELNQKFGNLANSRPCILSVV